MLVRRMWWWLRGCRGSHCMSCWTPCWTPLGNLHVSQSCHVFGSHAGQFTMHMPHRGCILLCRSIHVCIGGFQVLQLQLHSDVNSGVKHRSYLSSPSCHTIALYPDMCWCILAYPLCPGHRVEVIRGHRPRADWLGHGDLTSAGIEWMASCFPFDCRRKQKHMLTTHFLNSGCSSWTHRWPKNLVNSANPTCHFTLVPWIWYDAMIPHYSLYRSSSIQDHIRSICA